MSALKKRWVRTSDTQGQRGSRCLLLCLTLKQTGDFWRLASNPVVRPLARGKKCQCQNARTLLSVFHRLTLLLIPFGAFIIPSPLFFVPLIHTAKSAPNGDAFVRPVYTWQMDYSASPDFSASAFALLSFSAFSKTSTA